MIWVCANGPQMLRSAARYADGIFVGDHTPEDVGRMRAIVDPRLALSGRSPADLRFNNFWAWHVKETREAAHREARRWLAIRATPYPDYYYRDLLPEDGHAGHLEATAPASSGRSILAAMSSRVFPPTSWSGSSTRRHPPPAWTSSTTKSSGCAGSSAAGLTDIALRIYENPEWTIRLLGERVLPALA